MRFLSRDKKVLLKLHMECSNPECSHRWTVLAESAPAQPKCYHCGKRGVPTRGKKR